MLRCMTRTISIRIEESLIEAVDEAGGQCGSGRSAIIREALQLWLRRRALSAKVRRHQEGYRLHPVGRDEFAPVLEAQQWPK